MFTRSRKKFVSRKTFVFNCCARSKFSVACVNRKRCSSRSNRRLSARFASSSSSSKLASEFCSRFFVLRISSSIILACACVASSNKSPSNPKPREIDNALESSVSPQTSSYVGRLFSTSNRTAATLNWLSLSSTASANCFTSSKCEVNTSSFDFFATAEETATANAAPSRGSVPEPGSSSKTKESSVEDSKMRFNRRMCAPNVDNPPSPSCKVCESPKSHATVLTNGKICCSCSELSPPQGKYIPALAMSTRIPKVFNEAVLPPVFGPVMATAVASASM